MADDPALTITETLEIPLTELHFQFSRSGGPGGQHVNRSATQVELTFDVLDSPSLTAAQRARILSELKSYIDSRGTLHLSSQTTRSQHRNRAEVTERFQRLLQRALHIPKRRVPTRPPPQVKEQRLSEKRRKSIIKEGRARKRPEIE
ncbi:MAG TPA: alternative ribosome rescue aminoacyl-tRNA hydrolase ArfB [Candidatus Tectomicrobia bacterium]|nr:alternative ribosome rescue aminoacyl-tRNA hydrolase ArfB [Candidatus Tectomicrobia bacterium]